MKLKPFVFALFSQNENQRFTHKRKSLISKVDQPGLEQGPPDYESQIIDFQ